MYKVAICDDETIFIDDVSEKLKKTAKEKQIDISVLHYTDGQKLTDDIRLGNIEVNLVIFDVMLKGKNGIDLACELKNEFPEIKFIFITSFDEYAIDGYKAEASGFLVKPIDEEKLREAFLRTYRAFEHKNIIIGENNESFSINVKMIRFIEVYGKSLSINLKDNRILNITKSLSEFLRLLPSTDFVQCHRSFAVAIDEIESIRRYEITIRGGRVIPVSKLRYTDIQKAMIEKYSMN